MNAQVAGRRRETCRRTPAARFPDWIGGSWERGDVLRYGENPHQQAALYLSQDVAPGLAQARQLHGKPMSYNNYVDTDAARRAAHDFAEPCVAIIKHANPCGIAIGLGATDSDAAGDIAEVHRRAHACDPVSAFGGVIATNRPVTVAMAETVSEIFTEVVCAPSFEPEAVRDPVPQALDPARSSARGRWPVRWSSARSPAACSCRPRTGSTRRATTRRPGRCRPGSRSTRRPWPIWRSPGGPSAP